MVCMIAVEFQYVTTQIAVNYCESLTIHSMASEISKNGTAKLIVNGSLTEEPNNATSLHIPPKYVNSSSTTTESASTLKTSKNHKKSNKFDIPQKATISLSSKRMPVIEVDANVDSFNSSNQTTINDLNQTEEVTFSKDELFNQSFLHNLEQIKKDDDVPVISAAGIVGITLGCITIIASVIFVSFVVYRNRGLNRPQVLNDHCSNLDSSGYIDDASIRVMAPNYHCLIVKVPLHLTDIA